MTDIQDCRVLAYQTKKKMIDIKTLYIKIATYIMQYFRFDLQLHFFWSLFLTLLAIFWQPLIYLGLVATIVKEALDLWTKGHWSWDDFWCGFVGWLLGAYVILEILDLGLLR